VGGTKHDEAVVVEGTEKQGAVQQPRSNVRHEPQRAQPVLVWREKV
jgi:hypothetical protein